MLSQGCRQELLNSWLPHVTERGLERVIELLEQNSPLLIHGSFSRFVPQGCLATHLAWNHPKTQHLLQDAGVVWLSQVAGLNPAFSQVVRAWDASAPCNWQMRADLLEVLKEYRHDLQSVLLPDEETPLLVDA